jgi:hypothetical protein
MTNKKKILENYRRVSDAWAEVGLDFPSMVILYTRDDLPLEVKREYEVMKEQARKDLNLHSKSQQ